MPIVKQMTLKNFYNYSNEVTYKFKEGINIVVADNNGGKSKLYNAFLWVLRDVVFDSDSRTYRNVIDPKDQFKIVSDKSKNEAAVGEEVVTTVSLIFENELAAKQTELGNSIYTVTKTIKSKKIKEGSPFLYKNWSVSLNQPIFTLQRGVETKQLNVTQDKILDKLLPHALQAYYMFQGEEISELVGNELTKAINKITGINRFDYFQAYLEDILKKSRNAFDKETKKITKNSKQIEALSADIKRAEETVAHHSDRIKELTKNFEFVDQQYKSLHEQYTEALSQDEIIKEISQIEEKINRAQKDLENMELNYNSHFFEDKWLLYGFNSFKDKFLNLRKEYNERKAKKSAESFYSQLPLNMPDVPSLDQMIKDMYCHVCNRPIAENSQEFMHLKKLRDRNNAPKKTQDSHLINFIDLLHQRSANFPTKDDINKGEDDLKSQLRDLNIQLCELTERKELLEAKKNKEKDAVMKLLNDYHACLELRDKLKSELVKEEGNRKNALTMLTENRNKFNTIASGEQINPGHQKKIDVLESLSEAFQEAKKTYYDDQAKFLTTAANKDYQDLTIGNQTAPGYIDISVSNNFQLSSELKNAEGGILAGQGTAFQRMKQLSLLLGIVKLGNNTEYPLIADAPVSELSPILTKNFFYTVPKNFKQSILMVKDLIDESSSGQNDIGLNPLGEEIKNDGYLDPRIYINNAKGKDQHVRETVVNLINN